ncbi:tetratricopeptide repeat-containing protein [Pseudoflavitalea rhizosphaerae]|uniref:tetratricopeptide repeat-containing protein n=1 Tax=Pseudoflavitalea rhizosphaerae TaxID=1884793 RepID=UPI000F8E6F12|nr:tetratricopeptide repeat-containing protein [Pseudoflavitalea rhizosphaerae]
MQQHIQSIVQHFFQKNSLHDVAEADLQQFTNDYPYAIIGQFLLAEKMRHDNQDAFHDQALRTSLYFNNPAWLYWQLQEHPEANLEGLKAAITMTDEPEQDEEKVVVAHTAPASSDITAIENKASHATPSMNISDPAVEHKAAIAGQPAEDKTETEQKPAEQKTENREGTPSAVALAEAAGASSPVINEIGFDPYHTIDYFASQGIKLKLEELAKDKLGQQLKSFTEWLRSMKRVGPAAINGAALDDTTQQTIQNIADTSIEGKDIVTEAMAEVWVKQGNYRKAIAIYEKLSLQNPVKSPYFADRIQQLKAL